MQKSISILLSLAALVAQSCNDNTKNELAINSKYHKLNDGELKSVLINNNIKKYPMFWSDDDGISIFDNGYALIFGSGATRAVYEIKNCNFCILANGQKKNCSYFITNGRRIF